MNRFQQIHYDFSSQSFTRRDSVEILLPSVQRVYENGQYRMIASAPIDIGTSIYLGEPVLTIHSKEPITIDTERSFIQDFVMKIWEQGKIEWINNDWFEEFYPRDENYKQLLQLPYPSQKLSRLKEKNWTEQEIEILKHMNQIYSKLELNSVADRNDLHLYYSLSFFNHGCFPNTKTFLMDCNGKRMIRMVASERIEKGQEIRMDYLHTRIPFNRKKRRELIFENLNFQCHCKDCKD